MQRRQPCKRCCRDLLSCSHCTVCSGRLPDLPTSIHIRAGTRRVGRLLHLGTGHSCFPWVPSTCHWWWQFAFAVWQRMCLPHWGPILSPQPPATSLLVRCVSIHPSTLLLHATALSVPPLPDPTSKPSGSGAELFYVLPNLHTYRCTCKYLYTHTDMLCKELCLFHQGSPPGCWDRGKPLQPGQMSLLSKVPSSAVPEPNRGSFSGSLQPGQEQPQTKELCAPKEH